MIVQDISFSTPQENIQYDDTLLQLAEKGQGGEVLRFWESQVLFVVLGRVCKSEQDVKDAAIKEDKIPVIRRSSGGGTVLQGKGCLNYALILSKEIHPQVADLKQSYQFILSKVIAALGNLGVEVVFKPISDIALAKTHQKISGNAQRRGRKFILHHGTILYNFDLSLIEKYLKMPKDIPPYREGRTHQDFVTNIPLSAKDIKSILEKEFATI